MPAKVDAEDRRRRLVLAAAEVIAEEGIGGLTNSKIASRLSGSTTVVTHYFTNRRELVLHTYHTMASRSRARVERAIDDCPDPLTASLCQLLPLDHETQVEWRVWLAFQGMSVGDQELTDAWARRAASAVDRVARLVEADVEAGRMPAHLQPDVEGGRLFALVQGISFQALVDPVTWSPDHLREIVELEVRRLRALV